VSLIARDRASRALRRPIGELTGVTALYAALALFLTWPLAPLIATHLGSLEGPGDPYLELWVLGWDLHTLSTRPSALLTLDIFDANIFHPAAGALAYSDHLILQALALLPVYWLTGDVVVCYNVLLLASLTVSGSAMYLLAREVTGSRSGAVVAGLAWAFWPYRIARLLHINLQALYFLPLALLFLHRTMTGRRRRDAVWLGVFAGLQAISSLNYGVITAVALAVVAVALAIGIGRWRSFRLFGRLLLAAALGALLVAPFAWPYWQAQQRDGFARNLFEAAQHAAVPSSYLQVPAVNRLYGRTHLLTARDAAGDLRPWRRESVERELFPGFTLIALALVGAWSGRRRGNKPIVWAMVALALVAFVLSLGPDGARPLYAAAHRYVFGFQAIRAPARFGVLVTAALSVLAALAFSSMTRPTGRRSALAGVASLLLVAEYASMPLPYVPRPPRTTAVGRWLASAPVPGAVLHLPLTLDARNAPPMVQSLEHWRPIVNGHSGQRPPFFTALVDVMSEFPSAEALWTLRDFDVRFVVSPAPLTMPAHGLGPGVPAGTLAETPLVERARLPDGVIYELVWTPEIEAHLPRPAPPPPPPPGQPTFTVGERATYEVGWLGGPLGVAAGQATIEVQPGSGAASYTFVARAATADWVRQFFEARDEFITTATRELLPIEHRRDQRQGRRHVRRTYAFDPAARTVRIGTPGQRGVVLSIPPGTRDAVSAFYYVRTLALAPGEVVRFPVSDGGRNLTIELTATRIETIRTGGGVVDALRVEPRIVQRVSRRTPVQIVVWLGRDGRQLPLAAEVSAGFGRLRLELVEYRAP
jgi:Protein of unknown function (DUF3108)